MIFVGGVSLSTHSSSSSCSQGHDILMDLMRHPVLVSASSAFNDVAERRFSASKDSNSSISRHNRWVYIFQREYATVDPALVDGDSVPNLPDCKMHYAILCCAPCKYFLSETGCFVLRLVIPLFKYVDTFLILYVEAYMSPVLRVCSYIDSSSLFVVGTDEATTCVGLVMRNQKSGMTSVAHLDSPDVVDIGLSQMLAFVINQSSDAMLDVHLIGGFDDASPEHVNGITKSHGKLEGYSFPLCEKIVDSLAKSNMKFQIHTLHVLGHNTRRDSEGNAYPIFTGFLLLACYCSFGFVYLLALDAPLASVETATGSILPANFDATTRCPDEVVRRIRVTASFEDCSWNGRLLETYDTQADQFVIAPCTWSMRKMHIALMLQNLSDQEILLMCSTSPSAEAPDFVDNQRRQCDYLIQHPDWSETFPFKKPRIFRRMEDKSWVKSVVLKSLVSVEKGRNS
ncbi:hypothetical protein FXO37_06674 [Capsicum annuum]|nr:hypothetical protein FXO37_06674 [Capsicum annuum]